PVDRAGRQARRAPPPRAVPGGESVTGSGRHGVQGPLLVAETVARRFGQTVALDGLSIEVRGGEVVAVVGPIGSGKSTLLLCLAGIIRPDEGEVRYRGRALGALSDTVLTRLRRDEFGFVFQFGQLVPDLTAVENVSLPLRLAGLR